MISQGQLNITYSIKSLRGHTQIICKGNKNVSNNIKELRGFSQMFTFYHNSYLLKVATKGVGAQNFQKKIACYFDKITFSCSSLLHDLLSCP